MELGELRTRWREFVGEADVLACWNRPTLDLLGAVLGYPERREVLNPLTATSAPHRPGRSRRPSPAKG